MMAEKEFNGVLALNWKTGAMTAYKKKPRTSSPWVILINVKFKVKTPEQKEHHLGGEITISDTQVNEMSIDEL